MNRKTFFILVFISYVMSACNDNAREADAYGNFEATEITISAEGNGRIEFLNLTEGMEFKEAADVGMIDTILLSLQKRELVARRRAVAAGLQAILSRIAVFQQQLVNMEKDRYRIEEMFKDGASTVKQVDDINGEINVVRREIDVVNTERAQVTANLESIDAKIESIKDKIQRYIINVPQAGVILEKYVEPFEMVSLGKPIFKMADLSEMILRVYISGDQLSYLKVGQEVEVQVDGGVRKNIVMSGKISWISSQAEFTPKIIQTKKERVKLVYAVKVLVRNDGRVKIGMPGEIRFR